MYRKFPKYSDTQKICCNHSKIWTMWLYHKSNECKRCRRNGKQRRPRSDCSSRSSLIWVYTVCPGISVRKLGIITATYILKAIKFESIHACSLWSTNIFFSIKPTVLKTLWDPLVNQHWTRNIFTLCHRCCGLNVTKVKKVLIYIIRATSWQNQQNGMCNQQRLRSAWASAQSDLSLHCHSKDSDQTGRMSRLIWIFAGRTNHFVGFFIRGSNI